MFKQMRSQSGSASRRGQTWVLGWPRMASRPKYAHPLLESRRDRAIVFTRRSA